MEDATIGISSAFEDTTSDRRRAKKIGNIMQQHIFISLFYSFFYAVHFRSFIQHRSNGFAKIIG
jgi:hypothetical protein